MADANKTDGPRQEPGNVERGNMEPGDIEPDNIQPPPHYREGRRQVLTADTARQGPSGYRVLIVLGVSLLAAIVIWAIGRGLGWF